ncbi:MAG: RHS repeat-associated core domain-containing protein, partial [Kiritimatiellae bacterium]|nr:RHS repeat-associated core domain-containing protein [Kiritimatiellia bacterium]
MGEDATMYDTTNFLGGALLGIGTNQGTYTVSVVTTNEPGFQSNTVFSVELPPENPQPLLYDANGNLTNDAIWAYAWNDENRLSAIEPLSPAADKAEVQFTYDGQGRRAARVLYTAWNGSGYATTNETRFLYDGWRVIAELSADNTVSNSYVWGLDLSQSLEGAGGIGGLLAMTDSSADSYLYFYDGNGNVTHLYATDGNTQVAAYEYDPFGNITKSSGSMAETNTLRFSTKPFEPNHGLGYWGERWYSSNLGRWVNRDRRGVKGGINLYNFVRNGPAGFVDTRGDIIYAPPLPPPICPSPNRNFQVRLNCLRGRRNLRPHGFLCLPERIALRLFSKLRTNVTAQCTVGRPATSNWHIMICRGPSN